MTPLIWVTTVGKWLLKELPSNKVCAVISDTVSDVYSRVSESVVTPTKIPRREILEARKHFTPKQLIIITAFFRQNYKERQARLPLKYRDYASQKDMAEKLNMLFDAQWSIKTYARAAGYIHKQFWHI